MVRLVLSFTGLFAGVALAVLSYMNVMPLSYVLGPYWLNHWAAWLAFSFAVVYVTIFIILKRKKPELHPTLIKVHETGLILAFMVVSLHFGTQIHRVVPPEMGTGMAAYTCLFVLVVTGIMQRNGILPKHYKTVRFVHLTMVVSFSLIIMFHLIRAFLIP